MNRTAREPLTVAAVVLAFLLLVAGILVLAVATGDSACATPRPRPRPAPQHAPKAPSLRKTTPLKTTPRTVRHSHLHHGHDTDVTVPVITTCEQP